MRSRSLNRREDSPDIRENFNDESEEDLRRKGRIRILPEEQQILSFSQTVIEGIKCLGLAHQSERSRKEVQANVEEEVKHIMSLEVANSKKIQMVCELLEEIYRSIDNLRTEYKSLAKEVVARKRSPDEDPRFLTSSKHEGGVGESGKRNHFSRSEVMNIERSREGNVSFDGELNSRHKRSDKNMRLESVSEKKLMRDDHHPSKIPSFDTTQANTFGRTNGERNKLEKYEPHHTREIIHSDIRTIGVSNLPKIYKQTKLDEYMISDVKNASRFFRSLIQLCYMLSNDPDHHTNNIHNLWDWIKDMIRKKFTDYKDEPFTKVKVLLEKEFELSRTTKDEEYPDLLQEAIRKHRRMYHSRN